MPVQATTGRLRWQDTQDTWINGGTTMNRDLSLWKSEDCGHETVIWHLVRVPKVTDRVGVTEGEAALAQSRGGSVDVLSA